MHEDYTESERCVRKCVLCSHLLKIGDVLAPIIRDKVKFLLGYWISFLEYTHVHVCYIDQDAVCSLKLISSIP